MSTTNPTPIYLKEYQVPPFIIDQVQLIFDLHDDFTEVQSELHIKRNPLSTETTTTLILDGEDLTLMALALDQHSIFEQEKKRFKITAESLIIYDLPEQFILTTKVQIYPHKNTALEGLYRSSQIFCTQCEAQGFRKITYFLDRPDVMARFNCEIRADKTQYPVLLSNGNPQKTGSLDHQRHYAIWDDPIPKPCYLFALVAGDLKKISAQHTTPSNKTIDLNIYVEAENIHKCDYAMRSLIKAMQWDEQQYGREYDLDIYNIVAVNDFNMGAMENKGLNIFNSKYVLTSPETATDSEYQGVEAVIAHEYFHNWTGNRITCRDWFQLSLKEGLTVYRDQCFSADMGSAEVKRIEDVRLLKSLQFVEDAGPIAHPVRPSSYIEINNFYTLTIYEKGAELVRMQAQILGAKNYRKAMDLYFERHDGQAVTTDDFVQCMMDASGQDLTQFKYWYDYAGTPQVEVKDHYNADTQEYILHFKQSIPDTPNQTDKPAFYIPFSLGLLDAQGNALDIKIKGEKPVKNKILTLTEKTTQIVFEGLKQAPTPSLLRGFSAPINLIYPYTSEQLFILMAHDSDGFNRWNASQQLLQQQLLQAVADLADHQPIKFNADLLPAYQNAFQLVDHNPALLAEMMTLPSESDLGEQMEIMDIEGIHIAREALIYYLATQLKSELVTIYRQLNQMTAFDLSALAIAQRHLKNRCLAWLMRLKDPVIESFCLQQYQAQQNMTDVLSALQLTYYFNENNGEAVLADFYQRWSGDNLVLDKWFSVQAKNPQSNCLEKIKQGMQNPHFSLKNPNKVRALIGTFANANPFQFHAKNGSGYVFYGEQIKQLDQLNPQIAARMMRTFASWRKLDASRQDKIKTILMEIIKLEGVSKDLYEITQQCLSDEM